MAKPKRKKLRPLSEHQIIFARLVMKAVKERKPLNVEEMSREAIHGFIELAADEYGLDRPKFFT